MGYDDFILTVNSSSIIILLGMAAVLLAATRFRGESGYAAAIIVLPNVPVYIYNMSRMLGWHDFTLFMLPIGYSANTLLMPYHLVRSGRLSLHVRRRHRLAVLLEGGLVPRVGHA